MRKSLLVLGLVFGFYSLGARPALANHVDSATVTPGCSSYTITLTASALSAGTTYTISWTITGLGPDINDSITFTASSATYDSGPIMKPIATLSGSFTPSGSATLVGLNTIPIVFSPSSISCATPPPPPCTASATNSSNFNGTPVPAGSYIWFNAHFKANNVPQSGVTIDFTNGNISFTAGGTSYSLAVPNARITFSPSAMCSSTSFDSATGWSTTVPVSGDDEIFLTGLAWQVPSGGLPGGVNPVKFSGTYSSETSALGLSIQMQWGAAAYSTFTTDYNALQIKAGHQTACGQNNGDHAGTPEGIDSTTNMPWKHYVVGGARGGGGSNFTGSWSGTLSINICP
jgi:hypothetical protein